MGVETKKDAGNIMTMPGHDLHAVFEGRDQDLQTLKLKNAHFKVQAERYVLLDKHIHRIEVGIETVSDFVLEDMKKERLKIMDELSGILATAGHAVCATGAL